MPRQASTFAPMVDDLYYFIYWICVFFFILIVALMVWFVIRYRERGEGETTPKIDHSNWLEIIWTVLPTLILAVMFVWGFDLYFKLRVAPHGAYEINVTAKRWQWEFTYPDGTRTVDEIWVPAGRAIKLIMTSEDVLHSFFVPSFRAKNDVLPNRYTTMWFEPTVMGEHRVYCAEYCGSGHSEMVAILNVAEPEPFQDWLDGGGIDIGELPPAEAGKLLFEKRACFKCHSIDDSKKECPPHLGVFGKREHLADGSSITVDEEYIRESIMNPNAKIVQGYRAGVMPTYVGLLKDDHVTFLIEYIKTLKVGMEKEG